VSDGYDMRMEGIPVLYDMIGRNRSRNGEFRELMRST
jgi:hypothetical protein